jgi:cation diffusion facilitator CzcD-associated flavoprotein CzcO
MSFWKQMPIGMKLRSNMSATNLVEPVGPWSLKSYLAEIGEHQDWPVPLSRFIDYGLWVQRNAVPDVDHRRVASLERSPHGFVLRIDDGETLTAGRVVVAGGIEPFEHQPPGFEGLPAAQISHTGHHRDMSQFAGRRVAVIGGGQSAFESATLMCERGAAEVEVLVRGADVVWLRSYSFKTLMGPAGPIVYAPTDVGPLWYSRLVATPGVFRLLPRDTQAKIAYRSIRPACSYFVKVRLDEVKVSLNTEVTEARTQGEAIGLTLSDGSEREVDHLMFGTGYRVDVTAYPFLGQSVLASLRVRNGYPLLHRGLESSVPRLHFVGAPAAMSFGPILRFVSGSWYAGRTVALAAAGQPWLPRLRGARN